MKLSEMREKTVDELQNAIVDWKKQLLESRVALATNKLENTATISKTKRLIAQAKTIIIEDIITVVLLLRLVSAVPSWVLDEAVALDDFTLRQRHKEPFRDIFRSVVDDLIILT